MHSSGSGGAPPAPNHQGVLVRIGRSSNTEIFLSCSPQIVNIDEYAALQLAIVDVNSSIFMVWVSRYAKVWGQRIHS